MKKFSTLANARHDPPCTNQLIFTLSKYRITAPERHRQTDRQLAVAVHGGTHSIGLPYRVASRGKMQGWKMASKKPRFLGFKKPLKNLKSPKFKFLKVFFYIFLVEFYTNHIYFHILIVMYEFC